MGAFRDAGLRSTRPRRLIAQQLAHHASAHTDFAAEDLLKQIQGADRGLSRATLFRAVDTLIDLGILDRIELGDGTPRYRVCHEGHHHHLICTSCNRIEEVDVCVPTAALASAAEKAGFAIDRHALELYGRCSDCRPVSA